MAADLLHWMKTSSRLLLNKGLETAEITVVSGGDSKRIVEEFRPLACRNAFAAEKAFFRDWVTAAQLHSQSPATI